MSEYCLLQLSFKNGIFIPKSEFICIADLWQNVLACTHYTVDQTPLIRMQKIEWKIDHFLC
jgi:hypothetical protein